MKNQFSKEQVDEFKEAFDIFSKGKNEFIATKDIGTVMRILGQNPSEDEIQQKIKQVGIENKETIHFSQFSLMMEIAIEEEKYTSEELLESLAEYLKSPESKQDWDEIGEHYRSSYDD